MCLTLAIGLVATTEAQEDPQEAPAAARPAASLPAAQAPEPTQARPDRAPTEPATVPASIHPTATDANETTAATDRQPFSDNLNSGWDTVSAFCSGHLHAGIGLSDFRLRDNVHRGRFLGTIDELKKESDISIPWLVGWSFNRCVSLECRYEKYEARTFTDTENNHSDGVVVMKGPIPYLVAYLPLDIPAGLLSDEPPSWLKLVAPFAGVGYSLMDSSMDADPWWALGYSSPAAYEALGSPSTRNKGYYRSFDLKDARDQVLMLGVSDQLSRHTSLNLVWTRADADIDSSFSLRGSQQQGSHIIPFHYDSVSLDARYVF